MRLLHTMLRVNNLEQAIAFYTQVLKMHVLKNKEYPSGRFTLVFLGYGTEDQDTVIELTYNWDTTQYELGTAFGHLAIAVDDINAVCAKTREFGCRVTREPGPMKFGDIGGHNIAFIEDTTGYKIELIERD